MADQASQEFHTALKAETQLNSRLLTPPRHKSTRLILSREYLATAFMGLEATLVHEGFIAC
jgi:hypothetical protein